MTVVTFTLSPGSQVVAWGDPQGGGDCSAVQKQLQHVPPGTVEEVSGIRVFNFKVWGLGCRV